MHLYLRSGLAAVGRLQDSLIIPALLIAEGPTPAAAFVVLSGLTALPKGAFIDRWGRPFLLATNALMLGALPLFYWEPLLGAALLGIARINAGGMQQAVWAATPLAERGISWETFVNSSMVLLGPLVLALSLLVLEPLAVLLLGQLLVVIAMTVWSIFPLPRQIKKPAPLRSLGLLRQIWYSLFLGATLTFLFAALQADLAQSFGNDASWRILVLAGGSMAAALLVAIFFEKKDFFRGPLFLLSATALVLSIWAPSFFLLAGAGALYALAMIGIRLPFASVGEKFQAFGALISISSLGAGAGYLVGGSPIALLVLFSSTLLLVIYMTVKDMSSKRSV